MRELEFIEIIKENLSDNSFIGNDCALLKDEGLYVTHDTMVEGVHFLLKYSSPYQIGYKAVVTNLSDLASELAMPKYITVSLSLPKNTDNDFVKKLYCGINDAVNKYNVKVVGGDITGADKVVVSICAIGKKQCGYTADRKNAKAGDVILTTGTHGSSAAGLQCLLKNIDDNFLINKHLMPNARFDAADNILKYVSSDIACMDTSDGLFNAVEQIAKASNVCAEIDFDAVPFDKQINKFDNYTDLILFGGEDYELVCTVDKELFNKLDKNLFFKIGEIVPMEDKNYVILSSNELKLNHIKLSQAEFDHFQ